jgi:hypothetical protein
MQNNLYHRLLIFLSYSNVRYLLNCIDLNLIISGKFILSIIYDDTNLINDDLDTQLDTQLDILVDSAYKYNMIFIFLHRLSNYMIEDIDVTNLSKSINIIQYCIFYKTDNPKIKINLIYNTNNCICIDYLYPLELYKTFYNGQFYTSNYTKLLYKIDYIKRKKINNNIQKEINFLEKHNFKITKI